MRKYAVNRETHVKAGIRSNRIVTPEGIRAGVVLFTECRIMGIEPVQMNSAEFEIANVGDHFVLPGLIDVHCHINEPGRTAWEGFETATRAAAAGGYTCVIDMPLNCIPSTTTVAALEAKRACANGKCLVDYGFWGGAVEGNSREIPLLAAADVRGFKCFLIHPGTDEFSMITEAGLSLAMAEIAKSGLPLLVHAELPDPVARAQTRLDAEGADWRDYGIYLQSRPEESEVTAIQLLIRLCREFHCRVHIVHLSAASALPELRAARREGLPITVETCPHYLYFAAEFIPPGATQFKCAPPIRASSNREQLWNALRDGSIDMIGTDHSPCPPAMKLFNTGDFRAAWGGISSLSLSLPAMWTAARRRGIPISDLVALMSKRPAELAGIANRKGRIAPGFDADLVVFDPDATFEVTEQRLYFRHPCSPYVGETLQGQVLTTFVRGRRCFDGGEFSLEMAGQEVMPS